MSVKLAPALDFSHRCFTVSKLKLVHKKGDNDIDNYRGITVTPALSNAYERVYVKQLNQYLLDTQFFDGAQYGFQAAFSTVGHNLKELYSSYLIVCLLSLHLLGFRVPLAG